jgi:hypothetical protein
VATSSFQAGGSAGTGSSSGGASCTVLGKSGSTKAGKVGAAGAAGASGSGTSSGLNCSHLHARGQPHKHDQLVNDSYWQLLHLAEHGAAQRAACPGSLRLVGLHQRATAATAAGGRSCSGCIVTQACLHENSLWQLWLWWQLQLWLFLQAGGVRHARQHRLNLLQVPQQLPV